MFGNMEDMGKMLGDLSSLQENASKLQAELESKVFSVKAGGGMIKVSINGKGEIVDLDIDDSLLEDKDSLQILLIGAMNDAYDMVQKNQQSSALNMLGGINPFGAK